MTSYGVMVGKFYVDHFMADHNVKIIVLSSTRKDNINNKQPASSELWRSVEVTLSCQ